MTKFIERDKSIILACDVTDKTRFKELLHQTYHLPALGAYKIGGLNLALKYGLLDIAETIKKQTKRTPLIYDHQKAGRDIPWLAHGFATVCREAGVDAAIIYGPSQKRALGSWLDPLQEEGLEVILGGLATYEDNTAWLDIYKNAASLGVEHFYLPANKIMKVQRILEALTQRNEFIDYTFYWVGISRQGGKIEEMSSLLDGNWHVIIGREIYKADNVQDAFTSYAQQLQSLEKALNTAV